MKIGLTLILLFAGMYATLAEDAPTTKLSDQPIPLFILPEAEALLADVRARLPQQRLNIEAVSGTRLKRTYEKLHLQVVLDYGSNEPLAQYAVFDHFGALREVMQLRFSESADPDYYHYLGEEQVLNPDFDPAKPIDGLAFGWNELSLAFLWWKGGKTIDRGYSKARKTFIVEIPAPADAQLPYTTVEVHIDQKEKFIYRAIAYDAHKEKVREIEADRLMKLDGLWMVKDIEIKSWPGPVKTVISIESVKQNDQPVRLEEGRPPAEPSE